MSISLLDVPQRGKGKGFIGKPKSHPMESLRMKANVGSQRIYVARRELISTKILINGAYRKLCGNHKKYHHENDMIYVPYLAHNLEN